MIFGPHPVEDCAGAVLAHSVQLPDGRLRKGSVLTAENIAALQATGLTEVIVARLEEGDIGENEAARRLAMGLGDDPSVRLAEAFTGRVNLVAEGPGVARVDADKINQFNRIDPMITIATVPDLHQVDADTMLATIKVISFAVAEKAVAQAAELLEGAITVCPPQLKTARLIVTDIPGGAGDKGVRAIEDRLARLNVSLTDVVRVPHEKSALKNALKAHGSDVTLILTGSATSDLDDVAPSALRHAGGTVARFGMPVDPGNLLFIGDLNGQPVIGLPGCARSPALNGTDWVLSRVVCGIEVSSVDIAAMGVGGLLKEIPTRPQPRRRK